MSQPSLQNIRGTWYVVSFTDGYTKAVWSRKMTDNDALARALWLINHGKRDEAELFIEWYCTARCRGNSTQAPP